MLNLASKPSILYEHSASPNSPLHGRADARAPLLVYKFEECLEGHGYQEVTIRVLGHWVVFTLSLH
jgi:hypothetical protein